ncbi:MAG: YdiU family protein [Sphingomonadaceae bacterium]|uniref:protein adenylyltransferase SelO n=1 Tax=Thermaurantiacus sp. TaxID=2820283 RepID=UPI00298F25FF|nr:YdiU family protein [Thermaurantiacus sp.]MCS6986947.1 YdiU family protein [Sphingomonadaceae bacterium]MDW8415453.1 YdiU family protein [Thermaurantiacus sp.]
MGAFRFDTSYARLPGSLFTRLDPEPVRAPRLVVLNRPLALELGLDPDGLDAETLSGNRLPPGATPLAQAYAGHQFGHFAILGDGRAHLLGEHLTPDGRRVDIQLKGSGRTPYSRMGDGRAALGPMLREFLISEAMAALGIPTTRSLAVVATGEPVFRDRVLPGAILVRVAASHLRVGTFQYAAARRDLDGLKALLAHAIARHAPEAANAPNPALALLEATMARQARLVAQWMGVGFIHGVMNTDNMAISGETIDYGPCAFMDAYHPATVFSSIDHAGRYAYANQPRIAHWNIVRFAEALLSLIDPDEGAAIAQAQAVVERFPALFEEAWLAVFRAKLGLATPQDGDRALIETLLQAMADTGCDFTNGFRALAEGQAFPVDARDRPAFRSFDESWRARLAAEGSSEASARTRALTANPALIPRNHRVEAALEAAEGGDLGPFEALLNAVRRPFAPASEDAPLRAPPLPHERIQATFCGT